MTNGRREMSTSMNDRGVVQFRRPDRSDRIVATYRRLAAALVRKYPDLMVTVEELRTAGDVDIRPHGVDEVTWGFHSVPRSTHPAIRGSK